jgi:hypothetical protein
MNLQDWLRSAADFMGPGAVHAPIVRHNAINMPKGRTVPKKKFSLHKVPQGVGHENIRADASSSDFNNTHLWEEPSATDTTALAWRGKREIEKAKRRNIEAFEMYGAGEVTGPCGCTLKVGEKVIVEGVGRAKILARNHRILTIMSAGGQKGQFDQKFVHHLYGYGTSEGVEKEWDTRGRKGLSVADQHQINIAKKTLKMNDAMAKVMGGMTKEEARAILKKHGISLKEDWNPNMRSRSQRPAEAYHEVGASK